MIVICLFGSASKTIDEANLEVARAAGDGIAKRGHTLVYGGGGQSVMGAAEAAARAAGGRTVGVIPEALIEVEKPPADLTELIVTPDMRSRKKAMDERSDAFLVLPGGIGTLEELFEIWVARTIGLHAKPLAILDGAGHYSGLRRWLEEIVEQGFASPLIWDAIRWTADVDAALDWLETAPRERILLPSSEVAGKFADWPTG